VIAPLATPIPARPLGTTFTKNGFHYELVMREGNVALFKQRLRPGAGCLAYEVIRIRVAEATTIMGKDVPRREVGPSNSEWGTHGWTYPADDLPRAKAKFAALVAAEQA